MHKQRKKAKLNALTHGTVLTSLCGRDTNNLKKLIEIFESGGYIVKVVEDVQKARRMRARAKKYADKID